VSSFYARDGLSMFIWVLEDSGLAMNNLDTQGSFRFQFRWQVISFPIGLDSFLSIPDGINSAAHRKYEKK